MQSANRNTDQKENTQACTLLIYSMILLLDKRLGTLLTPLQTGKLNV
jgi:hypothetical protein